MFTFLPLLRLRNKSKTTANPSAFFNKHDRKKDKAGRVSPKSVKIKEKKK